jgi:hypothetical protein
MPRISSATPSNAAITQETTLLTKQGKLDPTGKPIEFDNFKVGG